MPINYGGETYYIPALLWIVALFILVVCSIGGAILARNTYACPNCGYNFKKKWYQMMFTAHIMGDRLLKCPNCKKRDWCSEKE